jgi:uncharacterized heparinase superfamily protein
MTTGPGPDDQDDTLDVPAYTQEEAVEAFNWLRALANSDRKAAIMCGEIVRIWRQLEVQDAMTSRPRNSITH